MPDDLAFQLRPLTLHGLIESVRADMSVSAGTRRDRVSALNSFIKHLRLQPDRAQANVAFLRNLIADVKPAALGISAQTWANIRSNVLSAVKAHGAQRSPMASHLKGEWRELRGRLIEPAMSKGLSALIHFCATSGISPHRVDESVSTAFLTHLEEVTFRRRPRRSHRLACLQWNRAAQSVDGWPRQRLAVPSYRKILTFPPSHFAPAFQDDLRRWQERVEGKDLLDEHAPASPLRPTTVEHKRRQILRFASVLVRAGTEIRTITGLDKVVAYDALRKGLEFYLELTGRKKTPGLFEMAATLYGVAKHWCRLEPKELDRVRMLRDRLRCRKRGLSDKNWKRITPFKNPATLEKLHHLPVVLMDEAARAPYEHRAAWLAQTAVMIELLIMTVVRITNLCTLRIDDHLKFQGRGKDLILLIDIPSTDVKNGVSLQFELRPDTAGMVRTYLDHYRPKLAGQHLPWLFPGRKATHKHVVSAGDQIRKAIEKHLGHRVNPHLMRHLAALFWLKLHPGDYESLRRVLGHQSTNTLMDYYSGTETDAAVKRYDDAILAARRTLPGRKPKK